MSKRGENMSQLEKVEDNSIAEHARLCIENLPFVVGDNDLGRAQKHLALVFSSASADLIECTKESIGRAVAFSAMSGLMPGGSRAPVWLIPRWNKTIRAREANWQIAARGYQELAFRAGYRLDPRLVHEGDQFTLEYGEAEKIVHVPNLVKPGKVIGGYVYARSLEMPPGFVHMTREMINERKECSQDDGTWKKWPKEMALKTLCAYAGARGLFPADTGAKHAMAMSEVPAPEQMVVAEAPLITGASLINPEFSEPDPLGQSAEERVESALRESKAVGIRDELETRFGLSAQWFGRIEEIETLISQAANKRSQEKILGMSKEEST